MPVDDYVSWLLIEKGWRVLSADGLEVGRVSEVIGDKTADIFDGLAFRPHPMGQARYVPSEQVESIAQGAVGLDLGTAEVEGLDDVDRVFPRSGSVRRRIGRWLDAQRR